MSLSAFANELLERGFKIVPVNAEKRPALPRGTSWKNVTIDELKQHPEWYEAKNVTGLAIVAGTTHPINIGNMTVEYKLVLLDVDDPWKWDDVYRRMPNELREIIDSTWHWQTGPRCPIDHEKHDIKCVNDSCRHKDHSFKLTETKRGQAYALLVPINCEIPSFRGWAELLTQNYELIPPSIHPSGIQYEWVNKPPSPSIMDCEKLNSLINIIRNTQPQEQQQPQQPQPQPTPQQPTKFKKLKEEEFNKLVEIAVKYWNQPLEEGQETTRHWWASIWVGALARLKIDPIQVFDFLTAVTEKANDEEMLDRLRWIPGTYRGLYGDSIVLSQLINHVKQVGIDPSKLYMEYKGEKIPGLKTLIESIAKFSQEDANIIKQILRPYRCKSKLFYITSFGRRFMFRAMKCGDRMILQRIPRDENEEPTTIYRGKKFKIVAITDSAIPVEPKPEIIFIKIGKKQIFTAVTDDDAAAIFVSHKVKRFKEISTSMAKGIIKQLMTKKKGHVYVALYPDGKFYNDLHINIDTSCNMDSLVQFVDWIIQSYGQDAAKYPLAYAGLYITSPVATAIRMVSPNFVDYIVWNYGKGGQGKTTVSSRLRELLGLNEGLAIVRGQLKAETQLRNLVAYWGFPLVLDEQIMSSLKKYVAIILGSAIGFEAIGVHAATHGLGFETTFYNMASLFINTNVRLEEFLHEIAGEAEDRALARRFFYIDWQYIEPNFRTHPHFRSILGCLTAVWEKHHDNIISAVNSGLIRNKADLAVAFLNLMKQEYPNTAPSIDKIISSIIDVYNEMKMIQMTESEEGRFIRKLVDFVTQELKIPAQSWLDIYMALLNNQAVAGIKLVGEQQSIDEYLQKISPSSSGKPTPAMLHDIDALTYNYNDKIKVRIRICTRQGIGRFIGCPRQWLKYPRQGGGKQGHYIEIPIYDFLTMLENAEF